MKYASVVALFGISFLATAQSSPPAAQSSPPAAQSAPPPAAQSAPPPAAQSAPPRDAAEHAEKVANIRKLINISGGDQLANQLLDQMEANMKSSGGAEAEKYFREFRKEFDLTKVADMQVEAYDKNLSSEDVRNLVAFYESPTGKHMLAAMPQIMTDMLQHATELSQEVAQKVARKMKEEQQHQQQQK